MIGYLFAIFTKPAPKPPPARSDLLVVLEAFQKRIDNSWPESPQGVQAMFRLAVQDAIEALKQQ